MASDPSTLSNRPTYTSNQLTQYFEHINLPQKYKSLIHGNPHIGQSEHALSFLTALQKHQLAAVPFENISLHYSPEPGVSLDSEVLFENIIERNMGGYCMENNCFFATVLRSLGYELFTAGARVNTAAMPGHEVGPGPKYGGWSHMVNIVTIRNQRYMVDVGFGSNQSVQPLPLISATPHANIGAQSVRLLHAPIPQNTTTQKVWRFQHRAQSDQPWLDGYCFTELEFLPEDYAVMNWNTSTSPTIWFTKSLICLKSIMEGEEIEGTIVLFDDEIKWTIRGNTKRTLKLRSEGERVQALSEHFSIDLREDEKAAIVGRRAAIKDEAS
ncbi:MAG: hypothetical protein M4579_007474 [Chaenotheca gracillima]|nr:MAG: hypothetical protein M4579_007474 [Chaenotheca gracillima]